MIVVNRVSMTGVPVTTKHEMLPNPGDAPRSPGVGGLTLANTASSTPPMLTAQRSGAAHYVYAARDEWESK